ncbi:MAG: hypothetical protein IJ829_04310, partial [Kiritimatiellae bacterium]|nr:hypothetical protein [Kiritimatiellia bacterium]
AVAVALQPDLYAAATRGRADALACELRVRDSQGRDVPYAVRAQKTRFIEETREWRALKIVRVAEAEGRLVVDAEWPDGALAPEAARFLALRVDTPLTDFEQSIDVSSEGVTLASGVLCDYRKFADVRLVELPFEASFRRTLTVTFAKPTSEAAAAAFERTIRQSGDGKLEAKSVRESVVNRPFRIDALSVAVPRARASFKPAPPADVYVACAVETDARAKRTILEASGVFGLPATALAVHATDRNFSRRATVLRRVDARWRPFASGHISAVNLPGEKSRNLEIGFGREVREEALRIEIEDDDNPPLHFPSAPDLADAKLPLALKVTPYDVVFVAEPGEAYSLCVIRGAARARYDEQILGYIDRVQDPVRLALDSSADAHAPDGDGSPFALEPAAVLPFVSVVVFAALGLLCIWLLRANARVK